MVYELWFKGIKLDENYLTHIKKEHEGRFTADDFVSYVKKFVINRNLQPKHLNLYAVMSYDDFVQKEPNECSGLPTWIEKEKLNIYNNKKNTNTYIDYCNTVDCDTYDCICGGFKLTDYYIIKDHIRESTNRVLSYYR